MSATDYLENTLLKHVLCGTSFTSPGSRYIGLFTSDPGDAATGSMAQEVVGNNYARQSVAAFSTPTVGDPTTTSNSAAITFPVATADWGTITHFGIFSAATAGNCWFVGPLVDAGGNPSPITVLVNQQVQFLAGQLAVTAD